VTVQRMWSHETELPAVASSVSHARAFVSGHLSAHQLAYLVEDIELVVSELATNAMVHACTPFTVVLGAFENTVSLRVLDGSHKGPTLVVARGLETNGRGLVIVQALSRDWGVSAHASGGKSVWAEFDIRGISS
jgi:anti-sigma regulatory factor (Ser/Thr protein kinase)